MTNRKSKNFAEIFFVDLNFFLSIKTTGFIFFIENFGKSLIVANEETFFVFLQHRFDNILSEDNFLEDYFLYEVSTFLLSEGKLKNSFNTKSNSKTVDDDQKEIAVKKRTASFSCKNSCPIHFYE